MLSILVVAKEAKGKVYQEIKYVVDATMERPSSLESP
jgi:hypothetical protein